MSDTPAQPPEPAPPLAMPEPMSMADLVPPEPPKPVAPAAPPAEKGRSPIVLGLVVMAACALGMGAAAAISGALEAKEDPCAKLCPFADVPQVWANARFQTDLAAAHCTCPKTAAKPVQPPASPVPAAPPVQRPG